MAQDIIARGLAARVSARQPRSPNDHGASAGASGNTNRRAFRDLFAAGADVIQLSPDVYPVDAIPADEPVRNFTIGLQPCVILPPDIRRLDGNGATLRLGTSRGVMGAAYRTWAYPAVRSYLAADVANGATTVTLEAGEGLRWSVGDVATWRLGSVPGDLPETTNWGFARVLAVAGDVLTLERPMPQAFALAEVNGLGFNDGFGETIYNKALHKWPLFENFELCDIALEGNPDYANYLTEQGIKIQGARNLTLRNVATRYVGNGLSLQYVDGAFIENCRFEECNAFQQSLGKGISMSEVRDVVIVRPRFRGVAIGVSMEASAEASIIGGTFEHTDIPPSAFNPTRYPFIVGYRSRLTVRDFTITGLGGYSLALTGGTDPAVGGLIRFEGRLTLVHPTPPTTIWTESLDCMLDYRIGGTYELWDFHNTRTWRARLNLRDGTTHTLRGPKGQPKTIRAYASSSLSFGSGNMVTSFLVGHPTFAGANLVSQLEAGKTIKIDPLAIGSSDSSLWANRGEQMQVRVVTAAGMGLDANDEFIDVEIDYAVNLLDTDTTWSSEEHARRASGESTLREALFSAHDLPSIAANGTISVDFAVPDMLAGDIVEGLAMDLLYSGISVRSMEARTALCRVILQNNTAAAIDRTPQNIRIVWRRTTKG